MTLRNWDKISYASPMPLDEQSKTEYYNDASCIGEFAKQKFTVYSWRQNAIGSHESIILQSGSGSKPINMDLGFKEIQGLTFVWPFVQNCDNQSHSKWKKRGEKELSSREIKDIALLSMIKLGPYVIVIVRSIPLTMILQQFGLERSPIEQDGFWASAMSSFASFLVVLSFLPVIGQKILR